MSSFTKPGAMLADVCLEIPGARVEGGDPATPVRDVRHDSREVEPGDLFVARRGQKVDGAQYAAQAVARGAAAVIADRVLDVAVPTLVAPDPELALALASSAVWQHPSFGLEVVGITGTNGKTTTAWLIEQALFSIGTRVGLLGTVEHRFGALHWSSKHTTPEADDVARLSAAMRDAGATHLVMEVSSHGLALKRVHAVSFRVAVLTNVTQDHLDFHGTFEQYADTKRSLFLKLGPAVSVLNLDDPVGNDLRDKAPGVMGYSALGVPSAALRVTHARLDAQGILASVQTPQGAVELRSQLVGRHNLENLLAALGALLALGISAPQAAESLAHAKGAPGRLERVSAAGADRDDLPAVFVDYAHTPDALSRVLTALRGMCSKRLICVFGCGGDRDPSKRRPMGAAVGSLTDLAIVTTDNPRTEDPAEIAHEACRGIDSVGVPRVEIDALGSVPRGYAVELDRRRAIGLAIESARPGDVVLLAGKGHETYQETHGVRVPFDDREEARRTLAKTGTG